MCIVNHKNLRPGTEVVQRLPRGIGRAGKEANTNGWLALAETNHRFLEQAGLTHASRRDNHDHANAGKDQSGLQISQLDLTA